LDHQTFDRLTRLFGIAGSRRTAWRALLAGALLGATARSAAAVPRNACDAGGQEFCGIGGPCCPGKCFVTCDDDEEFALCCTGKDFIICEDPTGKSICCQNNGDGSCEKCEQPRELGMPTGAESCRPGLISGSYRRR
jgi:hypothetical protein